MQVLKNSDRASLQGYVSLSQSKMKQAKNSTVWEHLACAKLHLKLFFSAKFVAFTTESYVTMTCHEEYWWGKSAVLRTWSMAGRHTADNPAAKLIDAMEPWGLGK